MKVDRILQFALLLALAMALPALAQSSITENTWRLDSGVESPPATLADVAWLTGSWVGTGLGGEVEEAWTAPSGGSMIGVFKLLQKGEPNFYEFLVITERGDTIDLRLKHFTPEVKGWEEKDDFLTFPLVKIKEGVAYFRGLTFERDGADSLKIYLAMKSGETYREVPFVFKRQ